MIASLRGTVSAKKDKSIIVDVNGVGYHVYVTQKIQETVSMDASVFLYIHMHITENSMDMFGFLKQEQLQLFKHLISVSGIGCKSGLAILDAATINEIVQAVHFEDPTLLTKINGIGKKTAERLIVDLKSKLDMLTSSSIHGDKPMGDADVYDSMEALGYQRVQIRDAIKLIPKGVIEVNARIKETLKQLGKQQ